MTKAWTEERLGLLRELAHIGSRGWIMDRLNETDGPRLNRNQVIGKLWRMGLKAPESPQHTVNPRVYHPPRKPRRPPPPRPKPAHINGHAAVTLPPIAPKPFLALPFAALTETRCKYPKGHGGEADPFLFCGQAVWGDGAYCEFHFRLCHVGPVAMPSKRPAVRNEKT